MKHFRALTAGFLLTLVLSSEARAGLILSQLIVELAPGTVARSDVEVWNEGSDRAFVAVEPREIVAPGTGSEAERRDPDPERLGLLVSPARMIVEPGQRKLLRVAAIGGGDRERVYRVAVKPVVGQISDDTSGLKVLVGYDMLVLVRPLTVKTQIVGSRSGNQLTLRNVGNASVELVGGKVCDVAMTRCESLPSTRLYAGAEKAFKVRAGERVEYTLKAGSKSTVAQF